MALKSAELSFASFRRIMQVPLGLVLYRSVALRSLFASDCVWWLCMLIYEARPQRPSQHMISFLANIDCHLV